MQITNVEQFRVYLLEEVCNLKAGICTPEKANSTANLARQVLNSVKIELDTAKAQGRKPEIKFVYDPT